HQGFARSKNRRQPRQFQPSPAASLVLLCLAKPGNQDRNQRQPVWYERSLEMAPSRKRFRPARLSKQANVRPVMLRLISTAATVCRFLREQPRGLISERRKPRSE